MVSVFVQQKELIIEAGADAFGDGRHPTTLATIEAIRYLSAHGFQPKTILDVGCGSGLITLYAHHWWPDAKKVACDVKQSAVETAQKNFAKNDMPYIPVLRSDGLSHPDIGKHGPYDLVIGNILAEELALMAPYMKEFTASGSWVVLGGLLRWLTHQVEDAYRHAEFTLVEKFQLEQWDTLLIARL